MIVIANYIIAIKKSKKGNQIFTVQPILSVTFFIYYFKIPYPFFTGSLNNPICGVK